MKLRRIPVAVVAIAAMVCFAGTASAAEVVAGHDLWSTPPGGAVEDFGGGNTPSIADDAPPIPADFFDPGSDPFVGQVDFCGTPLGSFLTQPTGNADTIVERLNDTVFGAGQTSIVDIELVALSLQSCAPITVVVSGQPELWDVDVSLGAQQSLGTMTLTHDQPDPDGGTYDASLVVCPRLTFVRQSDSAVRALDYCQDLDPAGQTISVQGQPWVHTAVQPQESPLSGPNFFIVGQTEHYGPHPKADPIEDPDIPVVPAAGMWALIVLSLLLFTALGIGLGRRRTA